MSKRQAKRQASHAPEAIEANKKLFLAQLAAGRAPACAAKAAGVARSTAYNWKKEDADFDAKWDEAVETSLDKLETVLYDVAKKGDVNAIMNTLKWRRRSVYNNTEGDRAPSSQTNYFLNVTLQEQLERLERLGLPVPVIESDREEDYASDDANHS